MITVIPELPGDALGFEVSGRVTAADYEDVLIPAIDAALEEDGKIRLLCHITPEFEAFEPGVMWNDAKMGLSHLRSWRKIAFVTDVDWIQTTVRMFGFILSGDVRTFGEAELATAKQWLTE